VTSVRALWCCSSMGQRTDGTIVYVTYGDTKPLGIEPQDYPKQESEVYGTEFGAGPGNPRMDG